MKKKIMLLLAAALLVISLFGCSGGLTQAPAKAAEATPNSKSFPVPLLTFEAEKKGVDSIDLSSAKSLSVVIMGCLEARPQQLFTDPEIIAAAAAALEQIEVTKEGDDVESTATVYGFAFADADGNTLLSVDLQYDEEWLLLSPPVSRSPIKGVDALLSIEEILLKDTAWRDYYDGALPGPGVVEE